MEAVTDLSNEVINLTGKDVDNRLFSMTFNRLCQHQFSDPKLAYNIGYISKKVHVLTKDIMKEHGKLLDKYAKKNEEGNFELDENKNVIVEDQESYKKDLDSVHEIELEVRKRKLDVNVLSQQGFMLSANDISVLEPLLCGLED